MYGNESYAGTTMVAAKREAGEASWKGVGKVRNHMSGLRGRASCRCDEGRPRHLTLIRRLGWDGLESWDCRVSGVRGWVRQLEMMGIAEGVRQLRERWRRA